MSIAKINIKKIELEKMIEGSVLSNDQKDLWFNFIGKVSGEEIVSVLSVLKDDINTLDLLTKNLQNKLEAISSKDTQKWQGVIADQKEYLSKQ